MAECFITKKGTGTSNSDNFVGGIKNNTTTINFNDPLVLSSPAGYFDSSKIVENQLINNDGTDFVFNPGNNDWEMCFKFKFDTLKSESCVIGCAQQSRYYYTPSIEYPYSGEETGLWFGISFNGSTWDINAYAEKDSIKENKYYWAKIIYSTIEGYKFLLSEDGINYEVKFETSDVTVQYQSTSSIMQLFDVAHSGTHIGTTETIDLNESYIKFGDTVVWGSLNNK